ncbi:unnamed protein product [Camellia sinensis]
MLPWRSFMQSKEFITVRRLAGLLKEWLYVLTMDGKGKGSHWGVLDCLGQKHRDLPPMPGPVKAGFGVVVLNGKLLVMGGYSMKDGTGIASGNVCQYDSCLNRWSKLVDMNVASYDFACTEVNGMVYAVGGYGMDGYTYSDVMEEELDDDEAQSLCGGTPKGDLSLVKQERKEKDVDSTDVSNLEDGPEEDKRE